MDIKQWGENYLLEANRIYDRFVRLKQERVSGNYTNFYDLDRRMQILYDIYLEMKHTGQYLLHYPGRKWYGDGNEKGDTGIF